MRSPTPLRRGPPSVRRQGGRADRMQHNSVYNNGGHEDAEHRVTPHNDRGHRTVVVLHSSSRAPTMPASSSSSSPAHLFAQQPQPQRQLGTGSRGIGNGSSGDGGRRGGGAVGAALATPTHSWQFRPTADAITNLPSQPSNSLIPIITNPGMTVSRGLNYQYDPVPVPAPGYDGPAMSLESHQPLTYMQSAFAQELHGPQSPKYNGRPMEKTMAVLSSEQYDDGEASRRSARRRPGATVSLFGLVEEPQQEDVGPVRKTAQAHKSGDDEHAVGERRRKKQKLSSDDEGDDDAGKKSRGRPRLDTKDETAADRRRTQIRMAQRAYRHRKETTISSLEKEVQELRTANEQMSNIFISLHDYALEEGLVQREPDFGNQLRSTTERFLALAKSVSSEDNSKDEDGTSQEGSKPIRVEPDRKRVSRHSEYNNGISQAPSNESRPAMDVSVWGYQVTRDDDDDGNNDINQVNSINWNQQRYEGTSRQDHQIISRATFDNASFGFDAFDNNDDLQLYRAEIPELKYETITAFQESLPLTKTLADHESSFGRHLQRAALESGFKLITSKTANPIRVNEVFGFCLRFETREAIALRLKRVMDTTSKDSLYAWRSPFVHLGGSGTYYPQNETMKGPLMPKFRTGMSMGPFTPPVINVRETAMFDELRINMPGFQGEFFDSNDVEGYLRGRGINIPPNVEFVTVDLDQLSILDTSSPPSLSDTNTIKPYSPETPRSPEARFSELVSQEDNLASQMDDFIMEISNNDVDMNFSFPFPEWSNQKQNKVSENPFDLADSRFNPTSEPQESTYLSSNDGPYQERHLATLSVTTLVRELISKATCLGRASGFRPMDVESALRQALLKSF